MSWLSRMLGRSLASLMLAFLLLPVVALVATVSMSDFRSAFEHGLWTALRLSLMTTTISAALVLALGTPLAWWLARAGGKGARLVELIVRLPTVTPPAVAGVALLTVFGRAGLLGEPLVWLGLRLPFTTAAVVVAQVFVAAPFLVLPLADAFHELDEELLWTARSLGAGPFHVFLRVALPLVAPALLGGLGVAWARALGEFGATLVFAGNLPGVTQTLPLAIYVGMESGLGPARALSLVLLAVALVLFWLLRSSSAARLLGRRNT